MFHLYLLFCFPFIITNWHSGCNTPFLSLSISKESSFLHLLNDHFIFLVQLESFDVAWLISNTKGSPGALFWNDIVSDFSTCSAKYNTYFANIPVNDRTVAIFAWWYNNKWYWAASFHESVTLIPTIVE